MGVIVLLIVVAIAVSVTMVMQSGGNDEDNDSGWAKWSSWGSCFVVGCGTGTQERLRLCKETADNGDESVCLGPDRQTQNCTVNCPIDGAWASWSSWGSCSAICGNGKMQRTRTCSDPAPQYGGQECSGSGEQTKDCTVHCPIDGAWAQWSSWGSCSVTCGNGKMQRTRTCSDPTPSHGGQECSGSDEQSQNCIVNCPVHGAWAQWSSWGSCSVTCGNGQMLRTRTCTDPAPQYGGQECSGSDTETETCQESSPGCSASVCFGSYTTFNESYRRESVTLSGCNSTNAKCDKVTGDSWYRFKLPSGENGVLDTCPEYLSCGTCAPIWMKSSHPTEFGIISDVTMAVSVGGGQCSLWSGSGSVTKCSVDGEAFYLYKLWTPPYCYQSYCAGTYSFEED